MDAIMVDKRNMKQVLRVTAIALAILLFFAMTVKAEQRTLLDSENLEIGGFGGPSVLYSPVNGEDGVLVGGQGALLVNRTFYLGAGGYGLATLHDGNYTHVGTGERSRIEFGYGGIVLGALFPSDELLHGGVDVMIGGGGLAQSYNRWDDDNDWQDDGDHHFAEDRFFVVQPTAHAELNVTHWMRLRGTVGYRWTSGISKDYSDGDFSGLVAGGGVIFGGF